MMRTLSVEMRQPEAAFNTVKVRNPFEFAIGEFE